MAIVFSTEDVHPRERLSYWRDAMGIVPHEFASDAGPAFRGTVCSEMLDDVMLSDFQCDPCEVKRNTRNIAHSDCDDFLLCSQLSGRAVFSQDDRQAVTERGAFVLLDPRRPFGVSYQGRTRSVSLKIPRRALESRLGAAAALTVQAMETHRPLAGLASGFLSMLPRRAAAVDGTVGVRLAEQVLDLIALAFSVEADQTAVLSSVRATALIRLKAAIEARLWDAALKPAAVAAAAGISVRYANDLLSQEGFSVERYILHRRLERCRRSLEDPTQACRMIGEIAFSWGFSDLSHFGRRFRAAYGLTPGDCRKRAQAPGASIGLPRDAMT
jgi:AraC family transcriptional regulator, positive regulator of tynA and feaB